MNKEKNKFIGIRWAAMLIDHIILCLGIGLTGGILIGLGYFIIGDPRETQLPKWLIAIPITIVFLLLSIYFNKDAIKGKSPAKRILGLIVLNNKTNAVANPIRCFFRNITLIIWPIELVFSLFSPERRIGDFIAGTKVIQDDSTTHTDSNIGSMLFAWVLGVLFISLLFYVQNSFF